MTNELTINYVHRTLCISAEQRDMAQLLCGLDPSGQGMFLRAYGAVDGEGEPTTLGYISHGYVSDIYDAIWPLKLFDGDTLLSETTGDAGAVVWMASENEVTVTEQQVLDVFAACDVSNQTCQQVLDRLQVVLL